MTTMTSPFGSSGSTSRSMYGNNKTRNINPVVTDDYASTITLTPSALAQVHTTLGLIRQATGGPGRSITNLQKALWIHQRAVTAAAAAATVVAGTGTGNNRRTFDTSSSSSSSLFELGKACHRLALAYGKMIRPIRAGLGTKNHRTASTGGGMDYSSTTTSPVTTATTVITDEARSSCKSLLQAAIDHYERATGNNSSSNNNRSSSSSLSSSSISSSSQVALMTAAVEMLRYYTDEERREIQRAEAERTARRMLYLTGSKEQWSSLPTLPIITIDEHSQSHGSSSQSQSGPVVTDTMAIPRLTETGTS
jgi:hypothetical protein